jgi:hypothetical protein
MRYNERRRRTVASLGRALQRRVTPPHCILIAFRAGATVRAPLRRNVAVVLRKQRVSPVAVELLVHVVRRTQLLCTHNLQRSAGRAGLHIRIFMAA